MLYHFSENPNIEIFHPRKHLSFPNTEPMVWAIDKEQAPIYFLPRDCPRICYWPTKYSTEEDIESYQSETSATKVIVVESEWYKRIQETRLYVYHLPDLSFKKMDDGAGYFISHETIEHEKVEPLGDLTRKLLDANVELRFTPSLRPLREKILQTSLHYSMIRLRNAKL
jgi:hypothetical protein